MNREADDATEGASSPGPGMYLRSVQIENYRSCYKTCVDLQPGVTVLVGENNSGKSNVVEALRLALSPLGGRRTRYFDPADFAHGREAEPITIKVAFDALTSFQRAHYIAALDVSNMQAIYTTRFILDVERPNRSRPMVTAGPGDGPDSESNKREQLCNVYLEPLRDARRELDSAESSRLATIIEYLTTADERAAFVEDANEKLRALEEHAVVAKTQERVQHHLHDLTGPIRRQEVGVRFTEYRLRRLAKALRLKMAESGVDLLHLAESGLGYANLLYIATVLVELQHAPDAELTVLLVEEPEAHLHPQLQSVMLSYLQDQADASCTDDSTGPAGRIQVVVTTHSPVIASSVRIENIVVLRSLESSETVSDGGVQQAVVRRMTHAIPVAGLGLDQSETRKLGQYLDATKAALLFGRRIVLVEGVSEAVLLPVLGRTLFTGDDEIARQRYRALSGLTIINVGSVDFSPYVRLLLTPFDDVSILDQLVIVTDTDPAVTSDDEEDADDEALAGPPPPPPPTRLERLRALGSTLGVSEKLVVCAADYTLEADLLGCDASRPTLRRAFLAQKPRSKRRWESFINASNPAEALYNHLRSHPGFLAKGQFAHDVAELISSGALFEVPNYLRVAVLTALGLTTTDLPGHDGGGQADASD
jgi:putative ATP-dependent endonuclease of OLD family